MEIAGWRSRFNLEGLAMRRQPGGYRLTQRKR